MFQTCITTCAVSAVLRGDAWRGESRPTEYRSFWGRPSRQKGCLKACWDHWYIQESSQT